MLNDDDGFDELFRPICGPIREAILGGFRHYQQWYAEQMHNHNPRTRACLINDHIVVNFLRQKLRSLGIRVFKVHNRILFDIRGKALLHFKKLDKQLLSSNIQTEFAFAFTNQQELPGIPTQLPRFVAGYIPSSDWTAVTDVCITLPRGNRIEWARSLIQQPETLTNQEEKTNEKQQPRRRFRRKGGDAGHDPSQDTGTDGRQH